MSAQIDQNNPMQALQDLIAGRRDGTENTGWENLDGTKLAEAQAKAGLERYQRALSIAHVFMTSEGRTALEAIRKITVLEPSFMHAVPGENPVQLDALHATIWMYVREGQNSIVRHIEECIKIAEQGPPTAQE